MCDGSDDAWFAGELAWLAERNQLRALVPDAVEREGVLVRAALAGMRPLAYLLSGLETARSAGEVERQEEARVMGLHLQALKVRPGVA